MRATQLLCIIYCSTLSVLEWFSSFSLPFISLLPSQDAISVMSSCMVPVYNEVFPLFGDMYCRYCNKCTGSPNCEWL